MDEILIRNVYHLATLGRPGERLSHVDILLKNHRIADLGHDLGSRHPIAPGHKRQVIEASTCVAIPGLVNTHHHMFQTLQRNVPRVQNAKLFEWLKTLYEIWKHVDEEVVYWSTLLGCAELLLTGCTTTSDHLYLFPQQAPAELLDAQFAAAEDVGIRFHATRGSMSRGNSQGGLPPDSVVQDEATILQDSERVIARFHDPSPLAMRRVALAPCSPFSVTEELMLETVRLARKHAVHCHTHLAETEDENAYCLEQYGRRPLQLMEDLDWLGPDIWFAHGVHFTDEELARLAATQTGVAHCPSSNMRLGSGIARVREMLAQGVPVGIGVDGSASNDTSDLLGEVRQAMLLARVLGGADALGAETCLQLATSGSARLLGRENDIGTLQVGRAADLVLVDLRRIDMAGALADPLSALLFAGITHRVHTTIVNGRVVVREGRLVSFDEQQIADRANLLSRRMLEKAGHPSRYPPPPWLADATRGN